MTDSSRRRLAEIVAGPSFDLAEANLLVACEAFPRLDTATWLGRIDGLAGEAVSRGGGPDAIVTTLRETGLRGDGSSYDDPRNSFLNEVLDRRCGLPIALAALTIAVADRIGVPFDGVGMPGHFIVADRSGEEIRYLDPFHDWGVLSVDDCARLVEGSAGIPFAPEHLAPAERRQILRRMLVNLTGSYLRRSMLDDARWAIELQVIVDPHDPALRSQLDAIDELDAG